MEENLPQPQIPVPPAEPPPPKRFPLKWIIIVTLLAGIVLTGTFLIFKTQSGFFPRQSNEVVNKNESIKIGEYKVLAKDGWEELGYLNTREAKNTNDVYSTFSQLYSSYVDKKGEMYVKDIVVKGDTAEVYFGGDESWLTDRMGSTGPYNYSGLVTFALTEDPGIKKVDFKLQSAGTHFGPGIRAREDFIELWSTELLEKTAVQGNKQVQDLLQSRKTANWKTYTNTKYKFSISYSNNLSVREESHDFLGTQIFFFDDKETTPSGIKVSAIVYDKALGKTIDQDFDTLYALLPSTSKTITNSVVGSNKLTKVQNRTVGGKLAFDYIRNSLPIDPTNPEVGVGTYINLGTNILILEATEADRNFLDQMLGTFKLLDTSPEAFCGGIAGKVCPEGYKCQLDGSYPDAGGKCIKE